MAKSYGRIYQNKSNVSITPFDIYNLYPVGSIYMSVNSTNPSNYFGGTWEKIDDAFLWGTSDSAQLNMRGGESTHTLTVNEMPSHGHTFSGVNTGASSTGSLGSYPARIWQDTAPNWTGYFIHNSGGSQPHNNMPPYYIVFIWKRVA